MACSLGGIGLSSLPADTCAFQCLCRYFHPLGVHHGKADRAASVKTAGAVFPTGTESNVRKVLHSAPRQLGINTTELIVECRIAALCVCRGQLSRSTSKEATQRTIR